MSVQIADSPPTAASQLQIAWCSRCGYSKLGNAEKAWLWSKYWSKALVRSIVNSICGLPSRARIAVSQGRCLVRWILA